jgi:hypothetical protein
MKPKKCKICADKFEPLKTTQQVCGWACAVAMATKQREAKERKAYKVAKEKLKTKGDYLREAQIVFNRWIRLRDEGKNCISCDKPMHKKINAGHYRSVGACPELRFNELNVHAQCEHCNSFMSGNIISYRQNLIKKLGIDTVEWLESKHEPNHYTIEQIVELKKEYSAKIKSHKL